MRILPLLVTFALGCGGATKPLEPPAPAGPRRSEAARAGEPGPTCKSAGEHMVDTPVTAMDPRPLDEVVNKLIELIVVRCDADRWTAASRSCLVAMKTPADADGCGLTEDQQAALVRDQQAKFGGPEPHHSPGPGH